MFAKVLCGRNDDAGRKGEEIMKPLWAMQTYELVERLNFQTTPGCHTKSEGLCRHFSRAGDYCSDCIDAELLRRGVDVIKGGSKFVYVREDRIRRKVKGESCGC